MTPAKTKTGSKESAEPTSANEFGSRLRTARKSRDMTLRDVSEATNISITYLSDLERGALANPTLDKLVVIARTLGVPVADLVGAEEKFNEGDGVIPTPLQELRKMPQFINAVAEEAKRWRASPELVESEWIRQLCAVSVMGHRPSDAYDYLFIFEAVRRAIEKS